MTKGQRAMAVAMLSPEPEDASERGKKGGRGKKAPTNGEVSGVNSQRLADARTVLAYSPELAEAVMRHGKPLQAAPRGESPPLSFFHPAGAAHHKGGAGQEGRRHRKGRRNPCRVGIATVARKQRSSCS